VAAPDVPSASWRHIQSRPGAQFVHVHVWRVSSGTGRRARLSFPCKASRPKTDICSTTHSVYADLDVECLRPSDDLFKTYNVSTVSHAKPRPVSTYNLQKNGRKAFFGRMGLDTGEPNSIPNAWMASTPGHPFFLLILEHVMKTMHEGTDGGPEDTTGPAVLFNKINEYLSEDGRFEGEKIDKYVSKNPTAKQFTPRRGLGHSIEVLPFQYIFPYSWQRDGEAVRDVCWATRRSFSAERCKLLLATDHWPSYTITYWSHTWSGEGHDEGNVDHLNYDEEKDKQG
jgi:inositol phosphorylceramide mannosyltransferase catalytic subunit